MQLCSIRHTADTYAAAQIGGFHEHGIGERRLNPGFHGGPCTLQFLHIHGQVGGLRHAGTAQDLLGHNLVHDQGTAEHSASHVRHIGQLQQALQGTIFAIGAVEQRKYDIYLAQRRTTGPIGQLGQAGMDAVHGV